MVKHVKTLAAWALGLQATLALAASPPGNDEKIVPIGPTQESAQLEEFQKYTGLAALGPGAPELRVWRYGGMFFDVGGDVFAGGRLRSMRVRQPPRGIARTDELDQPMPLLPVAVTEAVRALAAFDHRASDCDIADGETILVQASIDGRPLLVQASTPRSCHGEMSARVTALLVAIDALKPD